MQGIQPKEPECHPIPATNTHNYRELKLRLPSAAPRAPVTADLPKPVFKDRRATFDLPVRCMYKQVAGALSSLESSLKRLTDALVHRPVTANIDGTTERTAIRRACEAYSAIDYEMDDEIGDSVVCLGVIGAPTDVVKLALAVNAARHHSKPCSRLCNG
jgi:hypothetical protein